MAVCGIYAAFDKPFCYIDCGMLRKGRETQEVNSDGSEITSHRFYDHLGNEIAIDKANSLERVNCPSNPNPVFNMGGKVDVASAPLIEKICYVENNNVLGEMKQGYLLIGVNTPNGECKTKYSPYWVILSSTMCEIDSSTVSIVDCPKSLNVVSKCVKLPDGTTTWANVVVGVGMSATTVIRIEDDFGNIIEGEIADDCDCECEEDCP